MGYVYYNSRDDWVDENKRLWNQVCLIADFLWLSFFLPASMFIVGLSPISGDGAVVYGVRGTYTAAATTLIIPPQPSKRRASLSCFRVIIHYPATKNSTVFPLDGFEP